MSSSKGRCYRGVKEEEMSKWLKVRVDVIVVYSKRRCKVRENVIVV